MMMMMMMMMMKMMRMTRTTINKKRDEVSEQTSYVMMNN